MDSCKRIGLSLSSDLLLRCDRSVGLDDSQTRSEFVSNALEFYIAWLNNGTNTTVLTPALESVIGAKISASESNLARLLFKMAVEISMLSHLLANEYEFTQEDMEPLRKMCVSEVKRLGGKYDLRTILKNQSEEDDA